MTLPARPAAGPAAARRRLRGTIGAGVATALRRVAAGHGHAGPLPAREQSNMHATHGRHDGAPGGSAPGGRR